MLIFFYRPFSTDIARIEKSLQAISNSFKNELEFEEENYEQLKEAEDFLQYSGFKLIAADESKYLLYALDYFKQN